MFSPNFSNVLQSGILVSSTSVENSAKIRELLLNSPQKSSRYNCSELNISHASVRRTLYFLPAQSLYDGVRSMNMIPILIRYDGQMKQHSC